MNCPIACSEELILYNSDATFNRLYVLLSVHRINRVSQRELHPANLQPGNPSRDAFFCPNIENANCHEICK